MPERPKTFPGDSVAEGPPGAGAFGPSSPKDLAKSLKTRPVRADLFVKEIGLILGRKKEPRR